MSHSLHKKAKSRSRGSRNYDKIIGTIVILDRYSSIVYVIVEIPRGSQNKYEYDEKHNLIKLEVLFSLFHYSGEW